ncbi:MAG: sigma-70 family RNA polymerase sigma factor [Deltaproteobacteria bacterium]|nr:sigma-70 family RNA polymerase sigma factor [Deltaproteobacteria bacterium]
MAPRGASDRAARLRALVDDHHASIGRILRSLGVQDADVDDALQQTFVIASDKLASIRVGSERAFLVRVAVNVAARARRRRGRNREDADDERVRNTVASDGDPETLMEDRENMRMLDAVLDAMPEPLREVFVLFEVEEMTMAAIADALEIPAGTVASRLRKAREEFEREVKRQRRGQEARR